MENHSRLHSKQPEDQGNTVRVLLTGERQLLTDSLDRLLVNEGIAVTRSRSPEAVAVAAETEPNVIVAELPGSTEADLALIQDLAATGVPVVGVAVTANPLDEALWLGAGIAGLAGPTTSFESLREYIVRAANGQEVLALDRRYMFEDLLREHRRSKRHRDEPFAELTARERAVFASVYGGLSADQIAEEVCVSVSTVRSHIRSILAKLNVHSQLAAVALARTNGWFDSASSTMGRHRG